MDSVADVSAKGRFVGMAAAEEVVAKRVQGGVAARAGESGEFWREARKAEFML